MDRRQFMRVTALGAGAATSDVLFACASPIAESKGRIMNASPLSKSELGRMRDTMAGYIAHGGVPGMVTLVARGDDVHVEAFGTKADGGSDPVRRDTIFRISSMTKPRSEERRVGKECRYRWSP